METRNIYWPDQEIDSQGRKPRRRAVPFWKIQELTESPRVEKILNLYDNEEAARQALYRLRGLKELLPPGVWHFYVRDIVLGEKRERVVRTGLLGVFFIATQDQSVHWMFNSRVNMTVIQKQLLTEWENQESLKDKTWRKVEEKDV